MAVGTVAVSEGAVERLRIGIDLGGTKISGVVMGPDGRLVAQLRIPSPRDDYAATLEAIEALTIDLERRAGIAVGAMPEGRQVGLPIGQPIGLPVGIGTPGAWIAGSGVMKNCNSTWLNGRPLLTDLVDRLGPRVRVANDADCFALSEAEDGAGAGADLVFGVILGTGVGGGLIVSGRAHGGPNGLGGEWGHTPLPYLRQPVHVGEPVSAGLARLEAGLARRPCYCGRFDCVETFLPGPGLAAIHAELWGETARPEDLVGRTDDRARQTLALHRELLARSLAQVVNLLDPDAIVLGGGLSNLPGLAGALAARVPRYLFDSSGRRGGAVQIVRAHWGDDSGVRGAARLWRLD